jgi:hypothetical protein
VDPEGCPNAERVMRHGLMLPCHPTMTVEDCQYVYQVHRRFHRHAARVGQASAGHVQDVRMNADLRPDFD